MPARPKHNKKKWRFYFLFILVRTTTKSIQFINKPVFLFSFFPCCCFAFISKQQQQKNRHFIYDLIILWLGHVCLRNKTVFDSSSELSCAICHVNRWEWKAMLSRKITHQTQPLVYELNLCALKKKCNMHSYYSVLCTGTHRISHYFNMHS
jgi:hypothetical protein